MELVPIIAILSIFIAAPGIVFSFIYFSRKNRFKIEELRYKRDILALEIEKENARIRLMEAEGAKYDRLIADDGRK